MRKEQACKICSRILTENICPACKSNELSKSWKGTIIVFDAENSEVAKHMGITAPGKFAIKVK